LISEPDVRMSKHQKRGRAKVNNKKEKISQKKKNVQGTSERVAKHSGRKADVVPTKGKKNLY